MTSPRIAIFGVINAGKSTLINALRCAADRETSPIGGTTRAVEASTWIAAPGLSVELVDTPGIEEVGESGLDELALAAARTADLVLLVIAEDLTDSAHAALVGLREFGKPMIVALNKVDLLDEAAVDSVLSNVRDRLQGVVPPSDVIAIAAAPIVRERIREADGSTRLDTRRDPPRIAALEARLISALLESAEDLRIVNAASVEADALIARRDALRRERRAAAERVADETAAGIAFALAVNPVPLIDFLTGPAGVAVLVVRIAQAYGEVPSAESVRALAATLVRTGRTRFWGSVAGVIVGGALKVLPGLGHAAGAVAQAAAGGYLAHIFGRALVDYHENDHDWGEGGLVARLDAVASTLDRREITRGLVDRIKQRLSHRS
ncbi:MAG: GTPase [Isosphaeraceae bacterium]|nr:GTPase [Isosphaeraceae bacterium]